MSLTSYIKQEQVRNKIDEMYDKPDFNLDAVRFAKPICENPQLVGTAFDYLMRFWLEYELPNVQTNPWVAETAVYQTLVAVPSMIQNYDNPDSDYGKAETSLSSAKEEYESFLDDGEITTELIKATLDLAKLDGIYRHNYFPKSLGEYEENNVEDLRNLYEAIPEGEFFTKESVLLNPNFGDASRLVGGADADLVTDDTLLDIKTYKELKLRRKDWRQLIGYLVLADLDPGFPDLNHMGLYYSRFGRIWTTDTDIVYNSDGYTHLRKWFKDNS